MQIFSMIRSSEQLLNDNQCNGEDYVDINYFIDQNFNANDVDIRYSNLASYFPPAAVWGGKITRSEVTILVFFKYCHFRPPNGPRKF